MSDDRGSHGPVRRPQGTLQVGSIAGSPVLISRSWFLVAALIAVMPPRKCSVMDETGSPNRLATSACDASWMSTER